MQSQVNAGYQRLRFNVWCDLLVLYGIFIFTDSVGCWIKPQIIDFKNEVPVPSLQKGRWSFMILK